MDRKLYRDEFHKKVAGVCAGLADYFNVDVAIVRVIFLLALIFHGGGGIIYIIFWIVLPKKPFVFNNPTVDYTVPPQAADNNSFGNTAFGGANFSKQSFSTFPNQPRSTSLVAIIFGVILIIIGGSILLDNFEILPNWDFERLWPIALILGGGALMLSGERKKPWEEADWNNAHTTTDAKPEAGAPTDETPTV